MESHEQEYEFTYIVTMVQHMKERKTPLTFIDDIFASNEEEAIANMKEQLWSGGFDDKEISVIGAKRVVNWN